MAVSFYYNHHNLLNRWAIRMLESPWRFNGFVDTINPNRVKATSGTGAVWRQRHREMLAEAIQISYHQMVEYLGYYPKPTWINHVFPLKGCWYDRTYTLPKRKLIQFGKPDYKDTDNPEITRYGLTSTEYPPGYLISFTDSSDDLQELQNKYRIFLTGNKTILKDNLEIPHAFHKIEDGKYKVFVHAWELNDISRVYDEYVKDTDSSSTSIPNETAWGNSLINNSDSLEFYELDIDTDSVATLLFYPDSTFGESAVKEVDVTPYIINGEKGQFRLAYKEIHSSTQPFAVKLSYQTGLALNNLTMDGELERAIFALAHNNLAFETIPPTSNPHRLPLADRTSEIFQQDREKIWKEDYHVDAAYLNPLGLHYGHFIAWKTIQRRADRVKSSLANWLGV